MRFDAPSRGFETAEYEARLAKAQAQMAQPGDGWDPVAERTGCAVFQWISHPVLAKPDPALVSVSANQRQAGCGDPRNRRRPDAPDLGRRHPHLECAGPPGRRSSRY